MNNLATQELFYQLELEQYNLQKSKARKETANLKKSSEYLNQILMGKALWQTCLLMSSETVSGVEQDYGFLIYIINYLKKIDSQLLKSSPLIEIYYCCYQVLREEKDEYFEKLKVLLKQHELCFKEIELKDLYIIAINFSIKQLNKGNRKHVRESFELYRTALSKELLFEHGQLSHFDYKNICALGLGLKEFDWVKHFIFQYKSFLPLENREISFNYNFAKLHYEKGDFDKAMELLQSVKYDDSLPKMTSKLLLMKIYYELGEIEVLSSYLRSFEGSVRRQRKMGYHKENYLNVISIMRKLITVNPFEKSAIEHLKRSVEEKEKLPEKKWLLERIDFLNLG